MARAILDEIKEESIIILDNSEICLEIAKKLKKRNMKLKVITNYTKILDELMDAENIDLVGISGKLDRRTNS